MNLHFSFSILTICNFRLFCKKKIYVRFTFLYFICVLFTSHSLSLIMGLMIHPNCNLIVQAAMHTKGCAEDLPEHPPACFTRGACSPAKENFTSTVTFEPATQPSRHELAGVGKVSARSRVLRALRLTHSLAPWPSLLATSNQRSLNDK